MDKLSCIARILVFFGKIWFQRKQVAVFSIYTVVCLWKEAFFPDTITCPLGELQPMLAQWNCSQQIGLVQSGKTA